MTVKIKIDLIAALSRAQEMAKKLDVDCKKISEMLDEETLEGDYKAGFLSDLCDLLFKDPERAADKGYEGIIERILDLLAYEDLRPKTEITRKIPTLCPKCIGKKIQPFQSSSQSGYVRTGFEECDICSGVGFLWSEEKTRTV